jgi:predicted HAD superfamily Cof-like phosphohydrolase
MWYDILEFHRKFQLPLPSKPKPLPKNLSDFRLKFLNEELNEYERALQLEDYEGQLDALVDLVYVAMGTAAMQGYNFAEAWRRVHAANMSKVRAKSKDESKRNSEYDVVKPKNWKAPCLKNLV